MVLVLLFIVIGIAVPRFNDAVPALRVRRGADQVYAGLREARNEAATFGIRARFLVHRENRTWRVMIEPRPLKDADKFEVPAKTWDTTEFPEGVDVSALDGFKQDGETGEWYLEFRADGTAEADATVTLANEDGDSRTIKVTGTTGQVRFEEPKSE
jgi:hypothetical protein